MMSSIIAHFHSARQRLWFGKGVSVPPWWHQAGLGAPLFVGMVLLTSASCSQKGSRNNHYSREGNVYRPRAHSVCGWLCGLCAASPPARRAPKGRPWGSRYGCSQPTPRPHRGPLPATSHRLLGCGGGSAVLQPQSRTYPASLTLGWPSPPPSQGCPAVRHLSWRSPPLTITILRIPSPLCLMPHARHCRCIGPSLRGLMTREAEATTHTGYCVEHHADTRGRPCAVALGQ